MDFGSRFLDTIERNGGVGELFRPNIGVSTSVNSVVNSGVNFQAKNQSQLSNILDGHLSGQTL
jgi:hypothetical protein